MTTRARGRPSLYREEYAEEAYKLCLLGATRGCSRRLTPSILPDCLCDV